MNLLALILGLIALGLFLVEFFRPRTRSLLVLGLAFTVAMLMAEFLIETGDPILFHS